MQLHVYNHKTPFPRRFSVCVYMSTAENLSSLADFGFVTCLQPKKIPSLEDFQFVSTWTQQKSSLLWQIFSLCQHAHNQRFCFIGKFWVHIYLSSCLQPIRDFEFISTSKKWVCIYMSTTNKFPPLADFGFVSMCLHVYSQKVPFPDTFSVCLNLLTMGHYTFLGHHWRSRRYVFGIFFSLIGLNLGIWMQF